MSQSQPEDSIWASLPLAKFSFVTYPSNSICPTWNHLTSNTLKLVIQTLHVTGENGTPGHKIMMRIFKESEILVSQDLERLVRIRQRDASLVEVAQNSPRIAMRCPMGEGVIQKFEMRLSSHEDFVVVADFIRGLGLPIREGGPSQKQALSNRRRQESSLPAQMTSMSASPSILAGFQSRPTSASSSAVDDRSTSHTGFQQFADFKVPERPSTVESIRHRPGSSPLKLGALDSFAGLRPWPTAMQASAASAREPTRASTSSEKEIENYICQPSHSISDEVVLGNTSSQMKPSFYLHQLRAEKANITESPNLGIRSLSVSPFFPMTPATGTGSNMSSDPFRTDPTPVHQKESSNNVMNQPRTASTLTRPSFTSIELQDLMIPPRRRLPFDRPGSTPANLEALTVPPRQDLPPFSSPDLTPRSSSAVDLPPLPKPTPVTKDTIKKSINVQNSCEPTKHAVIKRVAQRKAPAPQAASLRASPPLETVAHETAITQRTTNEDAPSPLAAKSAAAARPASASSGLVSKANAPVTKRGATSIRPASNTKRPKMIDQSTQTQTLSGQNSAVQENIAPTDGLSEMTITAAVNPMLPTPPESFLNDLDSFVARLKNRSAPKELWQYPGYAEADSDHRQTMINDFICQNLENADFLQLCADTEVAWRRIGLKM